MAVLRAFYGQTGTVGDDKLAASMVDGIAHVRSVAANLAVSLDAIMSALEGVVETIDELMTRPLKEVVEDKEDA